ncbi:MAG: hypothetical protein M1834_006290 [Cirrosporium novae-zelandiae]|nr:MAG: hypothetical protein M1834_006290 [Cirrosporium novae-zelandiae]
MIEISSVSSEAEEESDYSSSVLASSSKRLFKSDPSPGKKVPEINHPPLVPSDDSQPILDVTQLPEGTIIYKIRLGHDSQQKYVSAEEILDYVSPIDLEHFENHRFDVEKQEAKRKAREIKEKKLLNKLRGRGRPPKTRYPAFNSVEFPDQDSSNSDTSIPSKKRPRSHEVSKVDKKRGRPLKLKTSNVEPQIPSLMSEPEPESEPVDQVSSDEDAYEVERILGKRIVMGTAHYQVKWKHYGSEYNEWLPVDALEGASVLLQKYEKGQRQDVDETDSDYEVRGRSRQSRDPAKNKTVNLKTIWNEKLGDPEPTFQPSKPEPKPVLKGMLENVPKAKNSQSIPIVNPEGRSLSPTSDDFSSDDIVSTNTNRKKEQRFTRRKRSKVSPPSPLDLRIKRFLDHRLNTDDNGEEELQYLIEWEGRNDNTWESTSGLVDVEGIIDRYWGKTDT